MTNGTQKIKYKKLPNVYLHILTENELAIYIFFFNILAENYNFFEWNSTNFKQQPNCDLRRVL